MNKIYRLNRSIRIYFSLIMIFLILSVTFGVYLFKNKIYFTKQYAEKNIGYIKYGIAVTEGETVFVNQDLGKAKGIPVLLYHGIVKEENGVDVTIEDFRDQMFSLKKAGYQTITIEDLHEFMKENKDLPEKSILITFDDGRKDGYYPADPIFKALDFNAVSFIIAEESINRENKIKYYLYEDEFKEMIESGRWEIQSHGNEGHSLYQIDSNGTKGRFYTNKLWLADKNRLETEEEFKIRIYNDLVNSKNDLERPFGIKIIGFAYPYGDYGQSTDNFPESIDIVLDLVGSIYEFAFYQVSTNKDFYNYPDKDQFMIKRISVKNDWDGEDLLAILWSCTEDKTDV